MKIEIEKATELFRQFLITRMNSEQETTNEMIRREHSYWVIEHRGMLIEEALKEKPLLKKIVAQFDTVWLQNCDKGTPVTAIFSPETTLAEIIEWEKNNTGHGQYDYKRMSDIRLSIVEEQL